MTNQEIENIFTYHAPAGDQPSRYDQLRNEAKTFAQTINKLCPPSREKSIALTNLQQTVMWANASIALNPSKKSLDE